MIIYNIYMEKKYSAFFPFYQYADTVYERKFMNFQVT